MIHLKSPSEIQAMREAGRLAAYALRVVGEAVKPGISTYELDQLAESLIRENGGIPTFKGYGGFPGSICASVNDEIVHGIPSPKKILKEGDIISIDLGATVNGWVGDNAWTFPVGKISLRNQKLLEIGARSLYKGIEQAQVNNHLGDIGAAIQNYAEAAGCSVVREYVGHGIGREMHEKPQVPNYGKPGRGLKLKSGLTIAIEPMVNGGRAETLLGDDGWLVTTLDGANSVHFEKTIAITDNGPLILTEE